MLVVIKPHLNCTSTGKPLECAPYTRISLALSLPMTITIISHVRLVKCMHLSSTLVKVTVAGDWKRA